MNRPTLNRQQSRELDRRAVDQFGLSGLVLMENAGRGAAEKLVELDAMLRPGRSADHDSPRGQARRLEIRSGRSDRAGRVVLCCGKGNNAGDGFVIARHLDSRGVPAEVLLFADPAELAGDARTNCEILRKMDVPMAILAGTVDADRLASRLQGAVWIVDALLGTGAQGEPRPPIDIAIDVMNRATAVKLAVDLPSGLDCDTGQLARHTFRADHTCTFVAAKPGFDAPGAAGVVGTLHVLDIGVPRQLVEQMLQGTST